MRGGVACNRRRRSFSAEGLARQTYGTAGRRPITGVGKMNEAVGAKANGEGFRGLLHGTEIGRHPSDSESSNDEPGPSFHGSTRPID